MTFCGIGGRSWRFTQPGTLYHGWMSRKCAERKGRTLSDPSDQLWRLTESELEALYAGLARHAAPGLAMVGQELSNRRQEAFLARLAQMPDRMLRATAFVDAGYLRELGARVHDRSPSELFIDGVRLREWLRELVEPFRFLRGYVYDGRFEPDHARADAQAEQLEDLAETAQIRVRLGMLRDRPKRGGVEQKGVDTLLVLDMLQMAQQNAYDIAVLVTGDADFAEAADTVQRLGRQVSVPALEELHGLSKELRQVADFVPIFDLKDVEAIVRKPNVD